MQTWLVHMRAPIRLMRELRLAGFLTLQLVVGGTVLAALVHPLFLALFAVQFATTNISIGEGLAEFLLSFLYSSVFIGGYLTSVVVGLAGGRAGGCCLPPGCCCWCRSIGFFCRSPPGRPSGSLLTTLIAGTRPSMGSHERRGRSNRSTKANSRCRSASVPAVSEHHQRQSRPLDRRRTSPTDAPGDRSRNRPARLDTLRTPHD